MEKVFVDTAAWIALINSRDALHGRALQVMAALARDKTQWITTEFVLLEVADALCAPHLRPVTIAFIESARRRHDLRILPLSDGLLQSGWELYASRPDKDWGLTDCLSFAAMSRENLTRAFSSDAHFAQAGFQKLL